MRIEIQSEDRLGISQEILTAFTHMKIDINAMEVSSKYIFVYLGSEKYSYDDIQRRLCKIEGVNQCREIQLLPAENRERHLKALLARLPDAVIDIDEHACVMALNQAGEKLIAAHCSYKELPKPLITELRGCNIRALLDIEIEDTQFERFSSQTIEIAGESYIAEVNPIVTNGKKSGAVISIKSVSRLGRQIATLQIRDEQELNNIIGKSANILLLKEQTARFAELDLPVLISGETGTGKELVARALHNASYRNKSPFLAINCAALPEHLLESELFGYASGAFTGAQKGGKPGLFELAEGGTVFLDEVAEMSPYLQAKLLRFLQDYTYRRLGGTKELRANIRVVSATHQNLLSMINKQQFREDLFYRLNVLSLSSPALRDRIEDIKLLAEHFIKMAASQMNLPLPNIANKAMTLLCSYSWPGNIRELQNVLFRAVALKDTQDIENNDIENALAQFQQSDERPVRESIEIADDWASAQAAFEKKLLSKLYPEYSTTRALAKRLKVSHNKIAMKLRQYNIGANTQK